MKKFTFLSIAVLFFTLQSFAQTIIKQINVDGINRDYRLYAPPVYDGFYPVPLVINLHGKTSTAAQHEAYCRTSPVADTGNFIVVHPNGYANDRNIREWFTDKFATNNPLNIDDVKFIDALIEDVKANYNIDANRIYIMGFSNGAFMTYTLAAKLSNKVAAICANGGGMIFPFLGDISNTLTHPMPVLNMHGTVDPLVTFAGTVQYPSADSLVRKWASYDGCNMTPTVTAIPNSNLSDGCTADRKVYGGGNLGSTVEFITIYGGQHSWPGATSNSRGVTCRDFNATGEAWKFFRRFNLSQFGGGFLAPKPKDIENAFSNSEAKSKSLLNNSGSLTPDVYPNPFTDKVKVTLPENTSLNDITIVNILGKKIPLNLILVNGNTLDIETSSWEKGIYFLRIANNKNIKPYKLVKSSD